MARKPREQPSLELPRLFAGRSRRASGRERVTRLPALPASLLGGALSGAAAVGLVWLALRGCEAARGTSSCGGAGALVLLVILALVVAASVLLLRALGVPHAGTTASLGMALVAVAALVVVDDLDTLPVAAALVAVAAGAFAVSQWLASANTEPGDRPR